MANYPWEFSGQEGVPTKVFRLLFLVFNLGPLVQVS